MGRTLFWVTDFTPHFLPDQVCDFGYDIMSFLIVLLFKHIDIIWGILIF